MKNKIRNTFILGLTTLFICNPIYADHHKDGTDQDASAKEILYIEYNDDSYGIYRGRYNSMDNELDRYHYFKSNFEKTFEKAEWPVNLKFERYPIRAPEGATILKITFLGLRAHNPIEVELQIWAKLKRGEKEDDFGVRKVRHVPSPLTTISSIERDLNTMYSDLAKIVVEDLNKTLFREE